jgi:uncharacterized protein HemY
MGTTIDLEAAIADLKQACDIDPADKSMLRLLSQWAHELKSQNNKDRSMMSGAFRRGQLYSNEDAAQFKNSTKHGVLRQKDKGNNKIGDSTVECRQEVTAARASVQISTPACDTDCRTFSCAYSISHACNSVWHGADSC